MGQQHDLDTISGFLHVTKGFPVTYSLQGLYSWFGVKANRDDVKAKILAGNNEEIVIDRAAGVTFGAGEITLRHFTKTFEWYTSEILIRELGFINSGFSAYIDGAPAGGDYDVLGFTPKELVYIECKAGRPTNLSAQDFSNFFARAKFLSASIAILYVDFVGIGNNHFSFRDFAQAIDPTNGDDIFQIQDGRGGPSTYRPMFSPYYVVDCSRTTASAIHNLRFTLRTHYALEEQNGAASAVSPMNLSAGHYTVTQVHHRR